MLKRTIVLLTLFYGDMPATAADVAREYNPKIRMLPGFEAKTQFFLKTGAYGYLLTHQS